MRHSTLCRYAATAVVLLAGSAMAEEPAAVEDDEPERPLRAFLEHGFLGDVTFEGGFTGLALSSSDGSVEGDLGASLDLVFRMPMGEGRWMLYVEGSSEPWRDRLTERVPESNGDAGSALDSDGDARLQVSEFHYRHPVGGGKVTAGLLDASAFLDTSRLANDETTQFLANPLINDPLIAFPDYTLGVAWKRAPRDGWPGITAVVARSHGLGDDDPSYSSLFEDDVPDADGDGRDDDKGLFAGIEGRVDVAERTTARLGVWTSTGDRPRTNGSGKDDDALGVYGVLDGVVDDVGGLPLEGTLWSVRLGWADEDLSAGEAFVSGAVEVPLEPAALGLGVAHTFASEELGAGRADTTVVEAYARFQVIDGVQLSPLVQYVRNSGLTDRDPARDDSLFVFGLRLQLNF